MSTRQDIMTALGTLFATLKKSGGYNLNLGKNVIEWPTAAVDQLQFPALCYADTRASVNGGEYRGMGATEHNLMVDVWIWVNTPEDARLAIEDVWDLLYTNRSLSGYARDLSLVSHEIDQQQADRRIVKALMTFNITYRTEFGKI